VGNRVRTGSIADAQSLGSVPVGQEHHLQVAGAPVDEGADRPAARSTDDQVTFPVGDAGAGLGDRWAGVNQPPDAG
jgi:hypothetical protein